MILLSYALAFVLVCLSWYALGSLSAWIHNRIEGRGA